MYRNKLFKYNHHNMYYTFRVNIKLHVLFVYLYIYSSQKTGFELNQVVG